jgi:Trk K+ transport system NAD-binding subunit
MSLLLGREFVMLGEGVDLVILEVPESLLGKTLAESGIGAKTALNVIGVQDGDETHQAGPATRLASGNRLVAIGTGEQRRKFEKAYLNGSKAHRRH